MLQYSTDMTETSEEKQVASPSSQASSSALGASKAATPKIVTIVEQSSTAAESRQQGSSALAVSQSPSAASQVPPSNSNGYGGSYRTNGSVSIVMTPGSPCSTEGEWNCATSGKHAQRCASGSWSAPVPMAAGNFMLARNE